MMSEARGSLTVGGTFRDALRVYKLLFRRSVTTAALVYAAVALLEIAKHATSGAIDVILGLAVLLASTAGPLLVQGALVEIVRNVHDGNPAERIGSLFASSRARLLRLFGASVIYVCGVIFGAILFIVPGVLAAARWCLLAPLVMLEDKTVGEARFRSSALVKGQTGVVLACVVLAYLVDASVAWGVFFAHLDFGVATVLTFTWGTLAAPFQAHILTVIYYRLADPERPIINPEVLTWRSVWTGAG
jgi:hypothetical protein